MNHQRLVVVGCGPVGLLAAIILGHRYERVDVLEKRLAGQSQWDAVSRSLQLVLSWRGWAALDRAGVAEKLRGLSQPIRGRVDLGTMVFSPYSDRGDAIEAVGRDALQTTLEEAAHAMSHVRLHYGQEVQSVDVEARTVTAQGPGGASTWSYDLLVGADGVASAVAKALHPQGGIQLRIAPQVYRETYLPSWPYRTDAFHFIGDGEVLVGGFPDCNGGGGLFVMHPREAPAGLFDPASSGSILARFPSLAPRLDPAHLAAWAAVSPGVMGSKTCQTWHDGQAVVLAGDAAHAILPFMGQGLNTGLEDILVLDRCLRGDAAIADPVALYAALRKPESEAIRQLSDQHAAMLFGAQDAGARQRAQRVERGLASRGWPDSYCAAAFSSLRFSEILRREEVAAGGPAAGPSLLDPG